LHLFAPFFQKKKIVYFSDALRRKEAFAILFSPKRSLTFPDKMAE